MLLLHIIIIAIVDVDYRNCNFILGSVAEVEQLQSITNYYLDSARNNTMPMFF